MSEHQATLNSIKDSNNVPKAAYIENSAFGNIPSDWVWKKTKDHLEYIESGISDSQNKDGNGVPVSRIETIANGTVNYQKVGYVNGDKDYSKHRLNTGDLLFSNINSREEIGKTAIYRGDKPLYHGMNLLRIRYDSDAFNPYFAYYAYDSPMAQDVFFRMSKAAVGQSSINQSQMERLFLPRPPLPEQRKIATVLYTVDRAIEKTEEIIEQAKYLRTGAKQDILTTGLEDSSTRKVRIVSQEVEVSSEWDMVPLPQIAEEGDATFTDGDWVESADMVDDGEYQLIQLGNIGEGRFKGECNRYVDQEFFEEENCTLVEEGDLLISRMAEPILRTVIVPRFEKKSITAVDIVVAKVDEEEWDKRYLAYLLNTRTWENIAEALASGSTRKRISRENMGRILVPKPALETQKKVADVIESIENTVEIQRKNRNQLQRLKRGLMQDLLSGTVRTTDTNIEVPEEISQNG